MILLWGLVVAAVAAFVRWAIKASWAALHDLYHALPDRRRRALGLTAVTAMLLILRGLVLSLVARDIAVASTAIGWLLAAIVLVLAYHWPRQ